MTMKVNTRRQEELEGAAGLWLAGLAPGMTAGLICSGYWVLVKGVINHVAVMPSRGVWVGWGLSWSCPLVLTGQTEVSRMAPAKAVSPRQSEIAQMAPTNVSNPRDHSNWFLLLAWMLQD